MTIQFLKDHCNYKAGVNVENHPNEAYLITLGVAELVKPKVEEKPLVNKLKKK